MGTSAKVSSSIPGHVAVADEEEGYTAKHRTKECDEHRGERGSFLEKLRCFRIPAFTF